MSAPPHQHIILAFTPRNQLALQNGNSPFIAPTLNSAQNLLQKTFPHHTSPQQAFTLGTSTIYLTKLLNATSPVSSTENLPPTRGSAAEESYSLPATRYSLLDDGNAVAFHSIDSLKKNPPPQLAEILRHLHPHLIRIPYLHLSENDFIYRFRPEKDRNPSTYANDPASAALYQSQLCSAIKTLARRNERTATKPVLLDFGPVRYLIPSHFGFCLGVKNAIERAYETLATNPGRRVFMLSELIHNPFVNEDLLRRGLRYLQTEKGTPLTTDGKKSTGAPTETLLWDTLTTDDIVIIPAFGATDEDKTRLISKGIDILQNDATCMLVEKVWKAARNFGQRGYTVIIHGKHEHEETKATFSNTRRHAHALIIRNLDEARQLAEIIASDDPEFRATFYQKFAHRHTQGFDVNRHLDYTAVVNQTTLLVNETRSIISLLAETYAQKFGNTPPDEKPHLAGNESNDTLCYATQVNQDALARALAEPIDSALIIGGKNSSNTHQLYRLCQQKLGDKAHFIQSETQIHSLSQIEHYNLPGTTGTSTPATALRPLLPIGTSTPKTILLTGGASCPDGIIQQVITKINSLFPQSQLHPIDRVLSSLSQEPTPHSPKV